MPTNIAVKPRQESASAEGSGTELRNTGEVPSPVSGPGNVGPPPPPNGFPVCTGKTEDCHQELGKPDAWAWAKEAPDAVFQTSTWTQALPPGRTVLIVCAPPLKYPAKLPWRNPVMAMEPKLLVLGPANSSAKNFVPESAVTSSDS